MSSVFFPFPAVKWTDILVWSASKEIPPFTQLKATFFFIQSLLLVDQCFVARQAETPLLGRTGFGLLVYKEISNWSWNTASAVEPSASNNILY